MLPENNYRSLTLQIKASDKGAFRALFDRHHKDLLFFVCDKLRDSEASEDIVQEVFIKIWERRNLLDENRSIKSLLYTIALHLSLNYIRDSKKTESLSEHHEEIFFSKSVQHDMESDEFKEILLKAIERLPAHPRIIFKMSRMEELSYKEIAERLSISVKTVESHIGKALKILRKIFPNN